MSRLLLGAPGRLYETETGPSQLHRLGHADFALYAGLVGRGRVLEVLRYLPLLGGHVRGWDFLAGGGRHSRPAQKERGRGKKEADNSKNHEKCIKSPITTTNQPANEPKLNARNT